MGYDYHIEYKKGPDNKDADSLSRMELTFLAVSKPNTDWWAPLQQECKTYPFYINLATVANVIQRDGVWFLKGKVVLNSTSDLIPVLLAECHSTPTGEHFSYHKTLSRLRSDFRWQDMRNSVKEYI